MPLAKALATIKQKAEQASVEWLALYNGVFQIHEPLWNFQGECRIGELPPLSEDDHDEIAKNETKLFFSDSAPERSRSILDVSLEIFYEASPYKGRRIGPSITFVDMQAISPYSHVESLQGIVARGFESCQGTSTMSRLALRTSICGSVILRHMFGMECRMRDAVTRDLYLLVRLCHECQVKLLDSYPTTDEVCRFVPSAANGGICFVLKRDVEALLREVELVKKPTLSLEKWERQKKKQVRKLQNRRNNLPAGIEDAEYTRQEEIAEILDTREQEITWRLRGYGWKESDIPFSGEARERWDQLVCKPKHLTSHFIKEQFEMDITGEQIGKKLDKLREKLHRAISDWGAEVRQDLLDIWNRGREEHLNHDPGDFSGLTAPQALGDPGSSSSTQNLDNAPGPVDSPNCMITFARPSGATTKNIRKLPGGHQLLLRAEVIFKCPQGWSTHPGILPCVEFGSYGTCSLGERWNPEVASRNNDTSTVARSSVGGAKTLAPTPGNTWEHLEKEKKKRDSTESIQQHTRALDPTQDLFFKFVPPDTKNQRM
ncbi:DNA mismatch repair protein MutS [Ceratobasidium theobromae]|uniref:DNA mismatch repair protein MutS n=1 Tax=Ceratobasidium theobromae TaxID=1582974 RepID=A0A5N5QAX5_9AGAM|nr:DNA mismatch repair protein MutS [Ceratobasidium theobromae]